MAAAAPNMQKGKILKNPSIKKRARTLRKREGAPHELL